MEFRHDINGLRAIAVLAVTIFHFNPETLPGGFIGVDIFFVISGFLMTAIITKGLDNSNFSFKSFYYSRARRIVPPLIAICSVLIATLWIYLTPEKYNQTIRSLDES